MGSDAQLKRFFPLIICVMIGLAAYFQASGIGQLVGASINDGSAAAPLNVVSRPGLASQGKTISAQPILRRNPFDSVTGPLDDSPIEVSDEGVAAEDSGGNSDDWYADPKCDFGRVLLISASDDPTWSFAAIEDSSGKSILRRRGDEIASHTVQFLSWDRVWLSDGSKRCQMEIGDKSQQAAPQPKGRVPESPRSGRRSGRALPPEMAAKIHKVSDTEFNVERSVVDDILENQAELMRSARIVPEKDGDKVVGIRLFGIRSGTLLNHLGLQNGDRLQSINDFEITDPQKALEAYGRLRSANSLKVKVNRKGQPVTIDFNIQ